MKRFILSAGLCLILVLLNSCLTTLHPIFTEKDLLFDSRLTGSWKKTKDGSNVTYRSAAASDVATVSPTLQRNARKIYIHEEKDEQGRIKSTQFAFMVKLGKYYYMDYYPVGVKENSAVDEFFAAHYIPMHRIYRIRFTTNSSFDVQQLDAGYLENLIKSKKIRIRHEVTEDGDYVITAPTEELQKYIVKYSDIPGAYNNDNSASYNKINCSYLNSIIMNKKLFVAASIIILTFFSSCLTSLNRLVTYSTVNTDSRIAGNWQFEDLQIKIESIPVSDFYKDLLISIKAKDEIKSAFESKEDSMLYSNSYVADFIKNGYRYYMICSLVKLGDDVFANIEPVWAKPVNKLTENDSDDLFSGGSYITSNSIAKLVFKGNEMEFRFIDPGYIREQLKKGTLAIKYEKDDLFSTDLITASSIDLQHFLAKYGKEERLYNKENTVTLKKI